MRISDWSSDVCSSDLVLRDFSTDKNQPIYVTRTRYQSDYAIRISARLKKSGLGCRSFDPTAQPRLSALDALSQDGRSIGVLVHLLTAALGDSEIHNLRRSEERRGGTEGCRTFKISW